MAIMASNSKLDRNMDKTIKCRTCLAPSELKGCTNITRACMFGKTIKEILLIFIPELVTSPMVGDYICSKCMRQIRNFTRFIESCIRVEKFLIEENIKTQRQNIKGQINSNINIRPRAPLNLLYILPTVNQNCGGQKGNQPMQSILKPLPLNFLLTPPGNNTSGKFGNSIVTFQNGGPSAMQNQVLLVPQIELQKPNQINAVAKPVFTPINSIQKDVPKVISSPQKTHQNIELQVAEVGNRICRHCGRVFTSEDWSTVECSKCTVVQKEKEIEDNNVLDEPSIRISDDDDNNSDVQIIDEVEPVTSKKQKADDPLKDLKSGFRDAIVSITQSSEQIKDLLKHFSEDELQVIEYSPNNGMEKKRLLFLGNQSSQCPQCKILLNNPKSLKAHFRDFHSKLDYLELDSEDESDAEDTENKFECPFCKTEVATALSLVQHLHKTHSIRNPFKCEKCGKQFKKREQYLEHSKRFKDSTDCTLKKCSFCSEKLTKGEYEDHLASHSDIVCDQCGTNFSNVHDFKRHYANHHDESRKAKAKAKSECAQLCPVCGALLASSNNLKLHMRIHEERTRDYMCHMCPKRYFTKISLNTHLTASHGEKKYQCSICNITVRTATALSSHRKLKHDKLYLHTCNICGEGFSRGDYYKRHLEKHLDGQKKAKGKKKYNYSVRIESKTVKCKYCMKIFKNVYLLKSHLINHVKSMRFKCKFCPMTFANIGTRYRHQKRHADPNFDLSCSVCWRRMDTKEELEEHLARHNEARKYKCGECGELIASKYLMRHHMSEKHTLQEEVEKEKETVFSTALREFLL